MTTPNFQFYVSEKYQSLLGNRKTGAKNLEDSRDYITVASRLKPLPRLDGGVDGEDADNDYPFNQRQTTQCVPTSTAALISSLCTRTFQDVITFNPSRIVQIMTDYGWYEEGEGAFVQNGVKAIVRYCEEHGYLLDTKGDKYFFPRFESPKKEDWTEVLDKNHQIITGLQVLSPMTTPAWVWKPNTTGGGHCVRMKDNYTKHYLGGNTWGRWGIRKGKTPTGNFWVDKADTGKLFRGFIIPEVRRVK